MKYLILVFDSDNKVLRSKEFKTYEKAKPYYEEQIKQIDAFKVYLTDVFEEFKGVEI